MYCQRYNKYQLIKRINGDDSAFAPLFQGMECVQTAKSAVKRWFRCAKLQRDAQKDAATKKKLSLRCSSMSSRKLSLQNILHCKQKQAVTSHTGFHVYNELGSEIVLSTTSL